MASASSSVSEVLAGLEMNKERYIALLTKIIGEVKSVQNAPPDYNPREDNVSDHVLAALKPYTVAEGGPLEVERVSFVEGRGNVIIKYPGTGDKTQTLGFVGSHLDVVPATPETWNVDPYKLTVDGDKLWGRGTTDCLGHVAAITELFILLAENKPALSTHVSAVFIASEEAASELGVGMDGLVEHGTIDYLKSGPIIWVDSADSQPCLGTAGAATWTLEATGKLFHSGLPHKGINSLELAMESLKKIQERFYADFPRTEKEDKYLFETPSTMKPTQWACNKNALNQICPNCQIQGDIRITPFYDMNTVKSTIEGYVADINADLASLPTRGPVSKFTLPATGESKEEEKGALKITWGLHQMSGIAVKLDSPGYAALHSSIEAVKGEAKPFSLTGSLPLVKELQDAGFDLQITGFGLMSTYHANNEYALLSDMADAVKVLAGVISRIETNNTAAKK